MNNSITEIKSEITDLRTSNEQTRNSITSNVSEISVQIQEIKVETEKISSEQGITKKQISFLETKISTGENKLNLLATDLNNFKISNTASAKTSQLFLNEQLISEMQERKKRENNIIIVGICEQTSAKAQERMLKDENDVVNIISAACQGIAKPIKVYRIGKYNPGKNRRIKICFDKPEPALTLLRNKIKFPDNKDLLRSNTSTAEVFSKCK